MMPLRPRKFWLYGFLTWLIPFCVSFLLFTPQGIPLLGALPTHNVLTIIGTVFGLVLAIRYFEEISSDYSKESWKLGIGWLAINLILDALVLVPLSGMSFGEYFAQIGMSYALIPISIIAIGHVLERAQPRQ